MTKELQKFMYENTLTANSTLNAHLGKEVLVIYNQTQDTNLPPVQMKIKGQLLEVNPFENINVSGKTIDFVSRRHIIAEIIEPETNKRLYDKTLVVNKNTKVKNDLGAFKTAILGAQQAPKEHSYSHFSL
ncbi:MAG: hypothetical protein IKY15_01195 [Clostridia bacterium]|nr:hypothetical protein [Clostridia bacterium]MBR5226940.1 hypothetical protein [Clostridia bacterium]